MGIIHFSQNKKRHDKSVEFCVWRKTCGKGKEIGGWGMSVYVMQVETAVECEREIIHGRFSLSFTVSYNPFSTNIRPFLKEEDRRVKAFLLAS